MDEATFWNQVVRSGLPRFRFLKRPLSVEHVDAVVGSMQEWLELRQKLGPGDQIWPFRLPRTGAVWGHRAGFVALRAGKFVGGIVVEVS
jgi:hypothetical protein